MPFQGLESVLRQIEQQYQSPAQYYWRSLIAVWPQVVGESLAQQTRLINLRSQVLLVAAANPVIVQTLMFKRLSLLKSLNAQLAEQQAHYSDTSISDLRFSTRGWHQPKAVESPYNQFNRWEHHPCRIDRDMAAAQSSQISLFQDPTTAFQRWANQMRDQHQTLPPCPQCGSPVLPGELQRWGHCSLCYAQSHIPQAQGRATVEPSAPAP